MGEKDIRATWSRKENGFSVLLTIIVIILAIVALRNTIAKVAIERVVTKKSGVKLNLKSVDIGLFKSTVKVEGIKVYDKERPSLRLLYAPLIFADYDLVSCIKGSPHLTLLKVNIEEITIARKKGNKLTLNLKSLGRAKEKVKEIARKRKEKKPETKKPVTFRVDKLILTLKRVRYIDYTKPTPTGRIININMENEVFKNVDNPKALISGIAVKALMRMGVSGIMELKDQLPLKNFKKSPSESPEIPKDIKKGIKKIKDIFRKL